MTQHKSKRIIKKFHDLSPAARQALAEHLIDRKIADITLAEAHGVVEINVQYIHKGRVHKVVYDETTGKLLAGSEPGVVDAVLDNLPKTVREVIKATGEVHELKIKHADSDDREWMHVHFIDQDGFITDRKMELDGSPFLR